MTWNANLDPDTAELVSAAFEKSWQFVKTDPELAHPDPQHMRARPAESLERSRVKGSEPTWSAGTVRFSGPFNWTPKC